MGKTESTGRETIITIGHDSYDIWWLLKEPFCLGGKPTK